ncbi:MAG: hypothetical protein ACYC64_00885 [Armatimonadota bacterium]
MSVIIPRRGAGLVDLIVAVFLLGTTGAIFSAAFPTGFSASRQAKDYKVATAIVQRKSEQVRAMNYESLSRTLLTAAGVIDNSEGTPYSFTSVDGVGSQLTSGTGSLRIEDIASDVKRVRITVTWLGKGDATQSLQTTTLVADKRPRVVN